MSAPRYWRTGEDRFNEAYDQYSFERDLQANLICFHGWLVGECQEGCKEENTLADNS